VLHARIATCQPLQAEPEVILLLLKGTLPVAI